MKLISFKYLLSLKNTLTYLKCNRLEFRVFYFDLNFYN